MLDLEERATTPERRNRIREIARRYTNNIKKTQMFRDNAKNADPNSGVAHDGFYTRVARSTYMGISG